MAQSVEATNVLEVLEAPDGLLALPAGRGIWIGTDLTALRSSVPDGNVRVRLHRGDAVSPPLTIPVSQQELGPVLAATTVTLTPDTSTYTFPAGVATFTNQQVAELTLTVSTVGTAGTPVWSLIGATAGFSISGTGNTRQILYTGARPTSAVNFLVQVNVPRTDTAQTGSDTAAVRTTLVSPPQRTAAEIADITRTNLDDFTQNITQLYTGSDLEWSVFSSAVGVATVSLSDTNVATISPVADGTTIITVVVSNAGGSAQYEFNVTFDVLVQPVIAWPALNYDTADARYEFASNPSTTQINLGTVLPTVSAPGATVGQTVFNVSSTLIGSVNWDRTTGQLTMPAGAAAGARTLSGELIVSVAGTTTARAATFRRAIQIVLRAGSIPVFASQFYAWTLPNGTDPPPAYVLGSVAASSQPGETQRFRIISGNTDPQKLFAINVGTGEVSYTGPNEADVAAIYNLVIGVVNRRADGSQSPEATTNARITVPAAPAVPISRNPAFAPVGGLSRTIQVGESFSIDFTGAFQGTGFTVSNTTSDTDIISVTRSDLTFFCTGLAVGTASFSVIATRGTETATWTVRVTVVTAPPTATSIAWYRKTGATTYAAVTSLAYTVTEGAADADVTSAEPLYAVVTGGVNNRLLSVTDIPAIGGIRFVEGGTATINLPGGGTDLGRLVRIFIDGTLFDFEQRSSYSTVIQGTVQSARLSGTDYASATSRIPLTLTIQNSNEPPVAVRAATNRTINVTLRIRGNPYTQDFSDLFRDPEGRSFTLAITSTGVDASSSVTSGVSTNLMIQPGTVVGIKTYTVRAYDGTQNSVDSYTVIVDTQQRSPSFVTLTWQNPTDVVSEVALAENAGTGSPIFSGMYATATAADADVTLPDVTYTLMENQLKTNHDTNYPFRQLESLATETLLLEDAFCIPDGVTVSYGVSSSNPTALAVSGVFGDQALITAGNLTTNTKVRLLVTASVDGVIRAGRVIYREILANAPLEVNTAVTYSDYEVTSGAPSVTFDFSQAFLDRNGESWTLAVQTSTTAVVNPVSLGNMRYRFDYPATIAATRTALITLSGIQGTRRITRTFRVTVRPAAPPGRASIIAKAVENITAEAIEDAQGNSIELDNDPTGEGSSGNPIMLRATRKDGSVTDIFVTFDGDQFFSAVGGVAEIVSVQIHTSPAPSEIIPDISQNRPFHLVMQVTSEVVRDNTSTDIDVTLTARNSNSHGLTATSRLIFRARA